jgi:hypothetical protein
MINMMRTITMTSITHKSGAVSLLILATLCSPLSAQTQNSNTTSQAGQVNINLTRQCADSNDNATYQDGRVNINRTIQGGCNERGQASRRNHDKPDGSNHRKPKHNRD